MRGLLSRSRVLAGPAVAALLLAPVAAGVSPRARLHARQAGLAARSRSALLGLYALDSRLDRARTAAAALRARSIELGREQASTRLQLAIAERALALSQRQLAARLRALYEQGAPDTISVFLGSSSLNEAFSTIDGLSELAAQNLAVIRQTRSARRLLRAAAASLSRREAELARLRASAAAAEAALVRARGDRVRYLSELATQQRLTTAALANLDLRARAAEAAATAKTLQSISPPLAPPAPPAPPAAPARAAASATASGGRTLTVLATGYSMSGRTATGLPVGWGVVAVDPSLIPLGTQLTIPGYGDGVAADTGGAVRGAAIDLWFPTSAQAAQWGRRTVTITLH